NRIEDAVVTQIQPFHRLAGRQHADHHVGIAHGVRGGTAALCALFDCVIQQRRHQVKSRDGVPCLDQVGRHRSTHVAKTKECNIHKSSSGCGATGLTKNSSTYACGTSATAL